MKNLTKYLARSGTIFCPKRGIGKSFRLWILALAICFWVAMFGFIITENLTTSVQFWLGAVDGR